MIFVRHISLRSVTANRVFGADISLNAGLNIIHAPNTSGKSTCLQAIIFGLGLERSLGPQLAIPLPYAMRQRIHEHEDAPYEPVLEAYVQLEIENDRHQIVTVRREVVGTRDTRLIQTWEGGLLTSPISEALQRDYYVLDGGAATHESGFHHFLARFIGWELPTVSKFDGTDCPLYLEAIFPMLFVEQKRGWSAIQGPFPTFLRIQDVARRVLEFLLDLEAASNRRLRAEIRAEILDAVTRWGVQRNALNEQAIQVGRVRGIPTQPSAEFAVNPKIELELFYENEWMSLAKVGEIIGARISGLEAAQGETVEIAAPAVELEIVAVREQIDHLTAILETLRDEFGADYDDVRALEARIQSLDADLVRNQDAQKLERLGSELGHSVADHVCPTCHQALSSELLPAVESVGMGLEENIAFVKSQIELYGAALTNARNRLQDATARYRGIERDLREKQQHLRALRQELVRPAGATSRSSIEQIVRLQSFLDRLGSMDETAISAMDTLRAIAQDWADATARLRQFASDDLTSADKSRIADFETDIQNRLRAYGFHSFQPEEMAITRDNFRPVAITSDSDGLAVEREINFEISASDAIRLKWAYYLSLLAVENSEHAGILIFDEPGQQEIESESLVDFLRDAGSVGPNRQVIASTSEALPTLKAALFLPRPI